MYETVLFSLSCILLVRNTTGVSPSLKVVLLRSQVIVGENVTATCDVPLTNMPFWHFRSSRQGSTQKNLYHEGKVGYGFENRIFVQQDSTNSASHVLTIRNVTTDDSGEYICYDLYGRFGLAQLSVDPIRSTAAARLASHQQASSGGCGRYQPLLLLLLPPWLVLSRS
jgi:hypothetical protein